MAPMGGFYSPSSTLLISTAFTTAYVSSIYLFPASRVSSVSSRPVAPSTPSSTSSTHAPIPPTAIPRDRNSPSVIRARLLAVTIVSCLACLSIRSLLQRYPPSLIHPPASTLLGLDLPTSASKLFNLLTYPLGLTASLFLGSLYVAFLDGSLLPGQRGFRWRKMKDQFTSLQGIRNYIVGPWTEELVFRSAIISISALGGWYKKQLVFLTPLYFGIGQSTAVPRESTERLIMRLMGLGSEIAHVHHAYEVYIGHGRTKQALVNGVLGSAFQFAYTTLFGWYAAFLFVRTGTFFPPFSFDEFHPVSGQAPSQRRDACTGSILPSILVHTFCNWWGLPPIVDALRVYPEKKIPILASYVLGIATFSYGLFRWTEPRLFGGSWYWN
ncbi:BQ5605_C001g00188 [Microbotryum silenes-dioicae]|uniref:intramembrane prenyl-peptidase Rce1 n=1 Tax=Microbotryum silenes-dioicae TaxID=796604 RepID=A0A2X0M6K1_9BASI|nr:BQ5605_C001g00188 [Microbotryum silenes-dioicae]